MCQKLLDLFGTHFSRVAFLVKEDVALDVIDVRLFRLVTEVLKACDGATRSSSFG
jgi:hypothetical protein